MIFSTHLCSELYFVFNNVSATVEALAWCVKGGICFLQRFVFGVELQMELVVSPYAQVSAITSDLRYMYLIYSLSSRIIQYST